MLTIRRAWRIFSFVGLAFVFLLKASDGFVSFWGIN
jgi:uncharacterized membrane protein